MAFLNQFSAGSPSIERYISFRYLCDFFVLTFFVDVLQISFKYLQKHHPFNISIKHLENIFTKITYVRYLKCIVKIEQNSQHRQIEI